MRPGQIGIICWAALSWLGCKNGKKDSFFSGTVDYNYSYSSDSLNADSIARQRPSKSRFSYDSTGYQSVFFGPDTIKYYYSGNRNRCISQTGTGGEYQCEDYGIPTDRVISTRVYDTDEKILGYKCRVLEMQKENSLVKYYISTELKIAPATYVNHRSYNWDTYGREANGGLILKLEHRFRHFTMNGIATGIRSMPGNFKALELPETEWAIHCSQ